MQTQRAFDRDLPVTEGGIREYLRLLSFLEIQIRLASAVNVLKR